MAIRSVVKRGDPRLQQPCQTITNFKEAGPLIQDLRDTLSFVQTLHLFTRGSGIAAPQIGKLWAVSVVVFEDREYVLCNPRIIAHSEHRVEVSEGCLSFFDVRGMVPRWEWVTVEAENELGRTYVIEASNLNFVSLLQHETDHLAGKLYVDQLPEGAELIPKPGVPIP